MLCVNPNPWEGNPYNKPKPLGKINHIKPRIFARNQTETHTQKTKPFLRFATVDPWEKSTTANPEFLPETKQRHIHRKPNHSFVSPLLLAQQTQKKPIISLSQRRPSAPFPSLPIHLFAGQPIHRKPKPLHF
jgi:hypothetical protein